LSSRTPTVPLSAASHGGNEKFNLSAAFAAAVIFVTAPVAFMPDTRVKAESSSNECHLPWVCGSKKTNAMCSLHEKTTKEKEPSCSEFSPGMSRYFEINLTASCDTCRNEQQHKQARTNEENKSLILYNTVIVLPDLLSAEECKGLCIDADRILNDKKAKNIRGCKTERWALYSLFGRNSQAIMDRVLGDHVLSFLELRLPDVAQTLFSDSRVAAYSRMKQKSSKKRMTFYWDDPVVIKYSGGNELAPHCDMRDLTIVIPLQYPDDKRTTSHRREGGTKFWLQETSPEQATATCGISVMPTLGSGIMFNGDITHSGSAISSGTRFVLMTSITFDDDVHDNDEEYADDDNEAG